MSVGIDRHDELPQPSVKVFRVKQSDNPPGYSIASGAIVLAVGVALLASAVCAYLAAREVWLLDSSTEAAAPDAGSLQSTSRALAMIALGIAVALTASLLAVVWLWRRYLSNQRSLRRVKLLAHDILGSMEQGVITVDNEDKITSINSAAIHLLDVDFECVGQPLVDIQRHDLPLSAMSRRVNSGQGPVRDHDLSVHRNGSVLHLRGDANALTDENGRHLGCVIHLRDVTERILMEGRMSRMEGFINLAALASGLHHEIKNPLTALSIHVQLLEEEFRNLGSPESVSELLGVLKTEVHRLNGVLESFRSFASLQRLAIRPTDALDGLEKVIRLIRPQAAKQNVQVTFHHPDTRLPDVPLDEQKFEQAMLNLAINAVEAMPAGGTLTITAAVHDGWLQVEVADTGSGIPEAALSNVFKPYFSTKDKGSGMGLAITEKLIGQHGGHVDFKTGPEGSRFRLRLPLEPIKESP
jgi:PAS domain S-box-containing protein